MQNFTFGGNAPCRYIPGVVVAMPHLIYDAASRAPPVAIPSNHHSWNSALIDTQVIRFLPHGLQYHT